MADRQKADLGGLLIKASERTQEQKAGLMMCDSLVPWSQVQAMLDMVQVALNLKTGFAEKMLQGRAEAEQKLLQAKRLQKSAMLNAEQLRQTLEATAKEKQRYLQQTEEMGVELRSQEHAIQLLEEENAKLEHELASLKARMEILDTSDSISHHSTDENLVTGNEQFREQTNDFLESKPLGRTNGLGRHLQSLANLEEAEATFL